MSEKPDEIRAEVSRAYAKAVTTPAKGGCCGGMTDEQQGGLVTLAGYTGEELRALPTEAVVNAFGCGNPVAFGQIEEGQVVLDLGSGAGIDLLLAAKKVGPGGRVIGVDMTDEMIERARQNMRAAGVDNVEIRKGIIEELPVEDASVDWVISNCVINLSPDKPRVFSEIARVLRPGGQMLVSDIVVEGLPQWMQQSSKFYSACIAGAISEKDYLAGLRAQGLEEVEVRDRLVYDAEQLVGLLECVEVASCCGSTVSADDPVILGILKQVEGRIQSVKVFGRKPA